MKGGTLVSACLLEATLYPRCRVTAAHLLNFLASRMRWI
jgi:hypothetical protein